MLFSALAALSLPAEVIRFKNGDIVTGTLTHRANGQVHIATDNFGEVVVDESRLEEPDPSPSVPVAPAAAVSHDLPTPPAPTIRAPGTINALWKRSVSISAYHRSDLYSSHQANPTNAGSGGAVHPGSNTQVTVTAMIARTRARDVMTLTGALTFAETEPWGPEVNDHSAEFKWTRILAPETHFINRTAYAVDRVRGIDYAASHFAGIGLIPLATAQSNLLVGPGVVLMHARKGNVFDDQTHAGLGLMASFSHSFNERFSIEHTLDVRKSLRSGDYWMLHAGATLNATLSSAVSVQFGLSYDYDRTLGTRSAAAPLGPTPKREIIKLNSGLQFGF